jgi:hypothetical protein
MKDNQAIKRKEKKKSNNFPHKDTKHLHNHYYNSHDKSLYMKNHILLWYQDYRIGNGVSPIKRDTTPSGDYVHSLLSHVPYSIFSKSLYLNIRVSPVFPRTSRLSSDVILCFTGNPLPAIEISSSTIINIYQCHYLWKRAGRHLLT